MFRFTDNSSVPGESSQFKLAASAIRFVIQDMLNHDGYLLLSKDRKTIRIICKNWRDVADVPTTWFQDNYPFVRLPRPNRIDRVGTRTF